MHTADKIPKPRLFLLGVNTPRYMHLSTQVGWLGCSQSQNVTVYYKHGLCYIREVITNSFMFR